MTPCEFLFLYGAVCLFAAVPAIGHGNMQNPAPWGFQFGMEGGMQCGPNGMWNCQFFTNETQIPANVTPTLEPSSFLRTWPRSAVDGGQQRRNPWFAPGTAPILSPCDVGGGNPTGCPAGDRNSTVCPGGGYPFGTDARMYNFTSIAETRWRAGSVVEVAWAIKSNHGGGFAYRLCKYADDSKDRTALTEACFQDTTLAFAGDTQWVEYGLSGIRTAFKANRTAVGTWPPHSMWTKNPIPACASQDGGSWGDPACEHHGGTQFPPPAAGLNGTRLYGFGEDYYRVKWLPAFNWSIVDKVVVPADLKAGAYALSWRWDSEQTPQVWSVCADIRIEV